MLTKVKQVSKGRALYSCSKCQREQELLVSHVEKGKAIFCSVCTSQLTQPRLTLRQKYPSEYSSWCHMRDRCTKPSDPNFYNYGGRGITVCKEWLDSFDAFFLYMGPKPEGCNSIERLNYNGNYEPSNCVWADPTTQNRNRSCNLMVTLNGKTQTVAEWIVELAVSGDAVYKRINRDGEDPLTALTRVVRPYTKKAL